MPDTANLQTALNLPLWQYLLGFGLLGGATRLLRLLYISQVRSLRKFIADVLLSSMIGTFLGWFLVDLKLMPPVAALIVMVFSFMGSAAFMKKYGPKLEGLFDRIVEAFTQGFVQGLKVLLGLQSNSPQKGGDESES